MNALTREQLIMFAAGIMVGGGVGYLLADHLLKNKYEKAVNDEVAAFKDAYNRLHKTGPYSDIEELVAGSGEPIVKGHQEERREQRSELGSQLAELSYIPDEPEPENVQVLEVVEETVTTHNVFDTPEPDAILLEERDPDKPYVILLSEFMENGTRDSITVTYFVGDDTLIDENENILDDIDGLIGKENLERFGHGSQDDSIVYVRNYRLGADFEVIRDEGTYLETVLGESPGDRHGERND